MKTPPGDLVHLTDGGTARAVLAPNQGGWLLGYARCLPGREWEEILYWSEEILNRYPEGMYAGNPVLFPLVSRNQAAGREHHYAWQGRLREMPQHGFARRRPWKVVQLREEIIRLELSDDKILRQIYPFGFRYRLTYHLQAGRLHWRQEVENQGKEPMPFSAGFHPYLAVPLTPEGKRTPAWVRLPRCREIIPDVSWTGYRKTDYAAYELDVNTPFDGTRFFTDLEQSELRLVDPGRRLEVSLNFDEAPGYRFVALWTRAPESPFFCLEPWTALPNSFTRQEELIILEPGEVFEAAFWLDVAEMEEKDLTTRTNN